MFFTWNLKKNYGIYKYERRRSHPDIVILGWPKKKLSACGSGRQKLFLMLALNFTVLKMFSVLCFVSIVFYFLVLHVLERKKVLDKFKNWNKLQKLINLLKKIIKDKSLANFMGLIASMATVLLLNLTESSITDAISLKVGVASASEIEKMEIALLLLTSSLSPSNKIFNSNNKDKNLKNGKKNFKWLILVLIILVFIFVIFNYNLINVFNFLISTRFLLSISLVSSFLGIIYNSSFLFFYNLFYNNKNIKIGNIKPKFLKTFLTGIKVISLSNTFSYDYQNKLFKWHIKFYSISFVLLSLYLIIF